MTRRFKRLECGGYVRECLYNCQEPKDKPPVRAAKRNATSLAQQRVNQNNSKVKLTMLIGGNFGPGDLFITPTFSPEHLPETYAEAQGKVRRFFDLLRTVRRRKGEETRYVYAFHHSESIRWHIHALVNAVGPEDWELVKSLWPWGDVHIKRLQDTEFSTPDALAGYLLKGWEDRPNSARSWCASTNLEPVVATTCWEHNPAAKLELPPNCELSEGDSWFTAYGSYEFIAFFRCDNATDGNQAADSPQSDSRELIDRGKI